VRRFRDMIKIAQAATKAAAESVGEKAVYFTAGSGGVAVVGGLNMSEVSIIFGMFGVAVGIIIQIAYNHAKNKREKELFELDRKIKRKQLES